MSTFSFHFSACCATWNCKLNFQLNIVLLISTGQSKTRTHTCTHTSYWLVLGRVSTKEYHPCPRLAYISYIWRVIKLINSIQFNLIAYYTSHVNFSLNSTVQLHFANTEIVHFYFALFYITQSLVTLFHCHLQLPTGDHKFFIWNVVQY